MLHILLTILKIIGIFLLILIGVLLTVVLLVLLVPVRYQAEAQIAEDKKIYARIHWLLHMFGVDICYIDQKLHVKAKVFCFFTIPLIPAKEKKKEKAVEKRSLSEKLPEIPKETKTDTGQITRTPSVSVEKEKVSPADMPIEHAANEKRTQKPSWFSMVTKWFRKIKYTFQSIYDKITNIKGAYDHYMEILRLKQTQEAFALCKDQLFRILRHVMPRKIAGECKFGLEDPASTGQLYGAYCAAVMFHDNRMRLIPDFDQKILEGWIKIKGRVRGITCLWAALRILFDKNIRYLIRILKQK